MASILSLIIPIHGIFLSFFFFIHTERRPGPNFFLGTLLLVLSSFSAIQLCNLRFIDPSSTNTYSCIFYELWIGPFVFLYSSILLLPRLKNTLLIHLLIISIILFMLAASPGNSLIPIAVTTALSIINGLYLLTSLYLTGLYCMKHFHSFKLLRHSDFAWIIVLNILVLAAVLISIGIFELCPVRRLYLSQLPKGLIVYYIYYRILDSADFRVRPC